VCIVQIDWLAVSQNKRNGGLHLALQGVAPGKGRNARTSSHRFALSYACAPALSHIPSRPSIPIAERSKGHRHRSRLDTIVAPSVIDIGTQSRLHRYPLESRLPVANPQQQHQQRIRLRVAASN
jgi:hypothetical protein